MTEPCITDIRGKIFPSQAAAARHFDVSKQTVQRAIENCNTDGVGLGRNHSSKKPVSVDGVPHESLSAVAIAHDVPPTTVRSLVSRAKRKGLQSVETAWGVLTWDLPTAR